MSHTIIRNRAVIAIIALGLLPVTATTAAARQDVGQRVTATESKSCPLTRVGAQYVHCDDLTGNGVPAPGWVPQR